jgi:sporulation protein YlmC with PRC-barrel domain
MPHSQPLFFRNGFSTEALSEQQRRLLMATMTTEKETTALIASSKVNGTSVYNTVGESVGSIDDIMIDKKTGKAAYAVVSWGGFLGMGSDYYPVPWSALKYDTRMEGYVTGITKAQLQGAPSFRRDTDPGWGNRDYETKVHDFYGVGPYWGAMV